MFTTAIVRDAFNRWIGWWPPPYYHTPLAPVFKGSRYRQQFIQRKLRNLKASGDYRLVHCHGGAVVLQRQVPDTAPGPMASSGSSSPCPWLE